jgi:hypothetical protein
MKFIRPINSVKILLLFFLFSSGVSAQTAVKSNPQIAEGFYHLGRALQRAGQTDEAKKATEKAQEFQRLKREAESLENRKPL